MEIRRFAFPRKVGCQMGCIFCASSGIGFVRDLTAVEMLAEVTKTAEDLNEPDFTYRFNGGLENP